MGNLRLGCIMAALLLLGILGSGCTSSNKYENMSSAEYCAQPENMYHSDCPCLNDCGSMNATILKYKYEAGTNFRPEVYECWCRFDNESKRIW